MDKTNTPPKLKRLKPFDGFRSGTHVAADGTSFTFSAADVMAIAQGYDPILFKAPVVVGHPETDAPAYGWIDAIAAEQRGDDVLLSVRRADVTPEFATCAIAEQRYNKVSMAFFTKDDPANPKPGQYYLRHVGFLGGAAPAVTGLRPVEFSATGALEFSAELSPMAMQGLGGALSDLFAWVLTKAGLSADSDGVQDAIDEMGFASDADVSDWFEQRALQSAFSSNVGGNVTKEKVMGTAESAAALAERESALAAREAALVQRENEAKAAAQRAEFSTFSKGLVAAGQFMPVQEESISEILVALAGTTGKPMFAAGSANVGKSLVDVAKELFAAAPKKIAYGELAGKDKAAAVSGAPNFAAPSGMQVDAAAAELHNKALAYQAEHAGMSYMGAVHAVSQS